MEKFLSSSFAFLVFFILLCCPVVAEADCTTIQDANLQNLCEIGGNRDVLAYPAIMSSAVYETPPNGWLLRPGEMSGEIFEGNYYVILDQQNVKIGLGFEEWTYVAPVVDGYDGQQTVNFEEAGWVNTHGEDAVVIFDFDQSQIVLVVN